MLHILCKLIKGHKKHKKKSCSIHLSSVCFLPWQFMHLAPCCCCHLSKGSRPSTIRCLSGSVPCKFMVRQCSGRLPRFQRHPRWCDVASCSLRHESCFIFFLWEVFKPKFFLFVLHTFLLDVGPEHLLRIFLLLVAVASRVLPTVWSPFSGYLKWRYFALPFSRNSLRPTCNFSRLVRNNCFHFPCLESWLIRVETGVKGALAQVDFHESQHGWYAVSDAFYFYLFSPSQGESGHVEGASCRVDKASKVVMNKVGRAFMFAMFTSSFNVSPLIWMQMRKLIAGYSCAACQIAGWFGGMSLRPVGMLYLPSWNHPLRPWCSPQGSGLSMTLDSQLKIVFAVVQRLWNYKILLTTVVKSANEHVKIGPKIRRQESTLLGISSLDIGSRWGSWTNTRVLFCMTLAANGKSNQIFQWIDMHCCKEATPKTFQGFHDIISENFQDQSRRSLLVASPAIPSSADPADADDLAQPPSPAKNLISANTMTEPPNFGNFVESKIPVTTSPSKDLQKVRKRVG